MLVEFAFWCCVFLGLYSYLFYPIFLRLIPTKLRRSAVDGRAGSPSISIIVAVHNEESRIRAKLDDLHSLDDYAGEVEIIVASDASSDATDSIVQRYRSESLKLVRNNDHEGKEAAQLMAIGEAQGDIILFSDVATQMSKGILTSLARHFREPDLGAISSVDKFLDSDGGSSGESAYVRYEMSLRDQESRVGSLVGLSGSLFAARRKICTEWPAEIPSDFSVAIRCVQNGMYAKSAPDIFGYYGDLKNPEKEFQRKVRTINRGMRSLWHYRACLNPFRYGVFALQLWSHKVLRWFATFFLLIAAVLLVYLALESMFYQFLLYIAAIIALVIMIGVFFPSSRSMSIFRIAYYFAQVNFAAIVAVWSLLGGKKFVVWTPSVRG